MEAKKKKQTAFRLPVGTLARLDELAEKECRNRTSMIEVLIERAAKGKTKGQEERA